MPAELRAGHSFVVPAFGDSPHLEECLASLRAQEQPSEVVISTSTPSRHIEEVASKYAVSVRETRQPGGIGSDWNAALRAAPTAWVTLAHQDDVYLPSFSRKVAQRLADHPDALLCFTSYRELKADGVRDINRNLRIKNVLIELAFLFGDSILSQRRKLRLLAFGSPIPCPSVTFNMARLGTFQFSTEHKVNADWKAWLDLARRNGAFVRIREVLLHHRIHAQSETWTRIVDGTRRREDLECFSDVWPRPAAEFLARLYSQSYRANLS
jgi:glycosyltransferase involved in cell wall biosynthesis